MNYRKALENYVANALLEEERRDEFGKLIFDDSYSYLYSERIVVDGEGAWVVYYFVGGCESEMVVSKEALLDYLIFTLDNLGYRHDGSCFDWDHTMVVNRDACFDNLIMIKDLGEGLR